MSNVHQLTFSAPVVQKDLFAHTGMKTHKFLCLDITKYDQCKLSDLIIDLRVNHIFDTRTFPVFRKPKFHYPQLFTFLKRNEVEYSTISREKDAESISSEINDFFKRCSYRGKLVSLIVIHDSLSQSNIENIDKVKNSINSIKAVQELYLSS